MFFFVKGFFDTDASNLAVGLLFVYLYLSILRYTDVPREQLEVFNSQLDWLNNGTYAYHLPRHGSLFTRADFEKADKTQLPIKIATHILNT